MTCLLPCSVTKAMAVQSHFNNLEAAVNTQGRHDACLIAYDVLMGKLRQWGWLSESLLTSGATKRAKPPARGHNHVLRREWEGLAQQCNYTVKGTKIISSWHDRLRNRDLGGMPRRLWDWTSRCTVFRRFRKWCATCSHRFQTLSIDLTWREIYCWYINCFIHHDQKTDGKINKNSSIHRERDRRC